jgi:hypothetical protein
LATTVVLPSPFNGLITAMVDSASSTLKKRRLSRSVWNTTGIRGSGSPLGKALAGTRAITGVPVSFSSSFGSRTVRSIRSRKATSPAAIRMAAIRATRALRPGLGETGLAAGVAGSTTWMFWPCAALKVRSRLSSSLSCAVVALSPAASSSWACKPATAASTRRIAWRLRVTRTASANALAIRAASRPLSPLAVIAMKPVSSSGSADTAPRSDPSGRSRMRAAWSATPLVSISAAMVSI